MKKIFGILMVLTAFLMAGNSNAQDNRPMEESISSEERAQKRTDHLKEKLSLNDAQAQSVYNLMFEQELQKEKERANRNDRASKVDMSMQDILDDKQMATYTEMKVERK